MQCTAPLLPLGAVGEELAHLHCVEHILPRPGRLMGGLRLVAEWVPEHAVLPVHVLPLCDAVADPQPAALGGCSCLLHMEVAQEPPDYQCVLSLSWMLHLTLRRLRKHSLSSLFPWGLPHLKVFRLGACHHPMI